MARVPLMANKRRGIVLPFCPWPPTPKLTPIQVLTRLQRRLEKRMESLQRVKLAGFVIVISELEVVPAAAIEKFAGR
jgi:hypothetical protein